MYNRRKISINTAFFPNEVPSPHNCGFVSSWRTGNGKRGYHKIYSFPTRSSLNRLAKVLCINTTVTFKPDNIEVASAYFKHDLHVTEIVVTGKLN